MEEEVRARLPTERQRTGGQAMAPKQQWTQSDEIVSFSLCEHCVRDILCSLRHCVNSFSETCRGREPRKAISHA